MEKIIRFGFAILEREPVELDVHYSKQKVSINDQKQYEILHQLELHIDTGIRLSEDNKENRLNARDLNFLYNDKYSNKSKDYVRYKRENLNNKYKDLNRGTLNLELEALKDDIYRHLWLIMDKGMWKDLAALEADGARPTKSCFPLYISLESTAEILFYINHYFGRLPKYEMFSHYVDLGIGIPYLAASIKYFFPFVTVIGIDFATTITAIKDKIAVTSKGSALDI